MPLPPTFDLQKRPLKFWVSQLLKKSTLLQKLQYLNLHPLVISHWKQVRAHLDYKNSVECEWVLKSLIVTGQSWLILKTPKNRLHDLLQKLWEIDLFYASIGGLIGYHDRLQKLFKKRASRLKNWSFHCPVGFDMTHYNDEVEKLTLQGIKSLPQLVEIYPVGGAGDRLGLIDSYTGIPMPTATLRFMGKSLLEWLIEDLQAKEYLYYKFYQIQIQVPQVFMTSHEKDNHSQILSLLDQNGWFGRDRSSIHFCIQPLVPMMTEQGLWALDCDNNMLCKPGGHGALWQLLASEGIFAWLAAKGKRKGVVRQINNPIAGLDFGLLAFQGLGFEQDKDFGFSSCLRRVGMAEGTLVLAEEKRNKKYFYSHRNIEYTDFQYFGIKDISAGKESPFSLFPSNTNILFIDLYAAEKANRKLKIPGAVLNLKQRAKVIDKEGLVSELRVGRLEAAMQSLSELMIDRLKEPIDSALKKRDLSSYLTYGRRQKTISATKNSYQPGGRLEETPEGCFFDFIANAHELLTENCEMEIPSIEGVQHTLKAPFYFEYHSALGPLYKIIGQKIRKGRLHPGAELQLHIAELFLEELDLQGSLSIKAAHIMGHLDKSGHLKFGLDCGKCRMRRVKIANEGVVSVAAGAHWTSERTRRGGVEIILEGNAEFEAEDISMTGSHRFVVPKGHRLRLTQKEGKLIQTLEGLSAPSWYWDYQVDDGKIKLSMVSPL